MEISNNKGIWDNRPTGITIKSETELDLMREAGRVVASVKAKIARAIEPGVTTRELDLIAEREIRSLGAKPSFKGYLGFPACTCLSLNEEIVHGIPGERVIRDGDIISVDVGAIVGGFHADSAFTVGVGEIPEEAQRLIDATRESLARGIAKAKIGARISEISAAVQGYAERQGYSVVQEYVGHGIGRSLHEEPQVPNYVSSGPNPMLRRGMAIAIEPMLNMGGWETSKLDDGWTVVTSDGSLSAHFEDSVAIVENGAEVLTALDLAPAGV